jgi:hypothetical protein
MSVEKRIPCGNARREMKFFPIRSSTPPGFLESKPFPEGNEDIVNLITLGALHLDLRRIHWQRSLADYTTYTTSRWYVHLRSWLGDENEARKRLTIEHSSACLLGFIEPACALRPKQPEWVHEIKHDGFHD